MTELEKLKELQLHDQNFENFNFDFEKRILTIIVSIYSEDSKEYDYWKIDFYNIENLKMSELNIVKLESLEIYSHEIIENSSTIFIEFIMLLGLGQPSFNLSFNFTEVQLELLKDRNV
ncbi:hypothetical protein [Cytophaga aurantiaca]|uniref:hypothetical protein n=1 Tax=Cytophaga aurantiaca TaxID=29530 RepID=UPI0003604417|nr:hypothetical protein [Cytophaga aurantiaca]